MPRLELLATGSILTGVPTFAFFKGLLENPSTIVPAVTVAAMGIIFIIYGLKPEHSLGDSAKGAIKIRQGLGRRHQARNHRDALRS